MKGLLPVLLAAPTAVLALAPSAQSLTTYNLNYTTLIGVGSLQGTLTIDETDPAAQSESINGIPAFVKALSLVYDNGTTVSNLSLSNISEFFWRPIASPLNFTGNLVSQFSVLNILSNVGLDACDDPSDVCQGGNTYRLASALPQAPAAVPAPLPLFGAAAAFGTSRRLRRRLKSRA